MICGTRNTVKKCQLYSNNLTAYIEYIDGIITSKTWMVYGIIHGDWGPAHEEYYPDGMSKSKTGYSQGM